LASYATTLLALARGADPPSPGASSIMAFFAAKNAVGETVAAVFALATAAGQWPRQHLGSARLEIADDGSFAGRIVQCEYAEARIATAG
jgi:hypothetical protein